MIPALSALALQTGGQPMSEVTLALQLYELVGAALGLVIAYIAYRGYRQNHSRPMLFVALGFALALGVPLVVTVLYLLLPISGMRVVFQVGIQTIEIIGLLCIIYGLQL